MITSMNLPLEILLEIIRNVRENPTLCNLARCSRGMYDSVAPFLYEHVELLWCEEKRDSFPLKHLTGLFLRRPDLAQHVRRFTLQGDSSKIYGLGFDKESEHDEILNIAFRRLTQNPSNSRKEEMRVHVRGRFRGSVMIALLLPALVKLEKLDLVLPGKDLDLGYLEQMLERACWRKKPFDEKPAFQHLRDVILTLNYSELSLKELSLVTLLPAIRAVVVHGLGISDGDFDDPFCNALRSMRTSSSLSHLELRCCRLRNVELGLLLQAPKALKTFTYLIEVDYDSFYPMLPHDIREAITPQEDFIENLWLSYEEADYIDPCCIDSWTPDNYMVHKFPMQSFSSFKCLKVLRIEAAFLVKDFESTTPDTGRDLIDIFPRTLQTLQIFRYNGRIVDALEQLIIHKEAQVPSLIELDLSSSLLRIVHTGARERLAKLEEICRSEHIHLKAEVLPRC